MAGISISILLLIIVGASSIFSIISLEKLITKFGHIYLPKTDFLDQADRDLIQLQVAERALINFEAGSSLYQKNLDAYHENLQQSHDRIMKYQKLIETEEEKSLLAEYHKARSVWEPISFSILELCKQNNPKSKSQAMEISFGEGEMKFEAMREYINKLEDINLSIAENENIASAAMIRKFILVFIFIILAGIVLTGITAWAMTMIIARPIREVTAVLRDISREMGI